jgi:hypothetical protein
MNKFLLNFKEFFESYGAGSLLSSDQTGSEGNDTKSLSGHPVFLPSLDMSINNPIGIPQVKKLKIVKYFNYKVNPIKIELDDGTSMFFTRDQYERIPGDKPCIPNLTKVDVQFQRSPEDFSLNTSKISGIKFVFIGKPWQRNHYKIKTHPSPFTAI